MLLGLRVRPVGYEHFPIGLLPQRLRVGGRGNAAGELSGARSNQFAVERVDLFYHFFGYGGRIEVVREVVANKILRHEVSCYGLRVGRFSSFTITSNDRTGIRQSVQEIFRPLLPSLLRIGPD